MLKPKFNVSYPININSLQYPPTSGGANTSDTHEKRGLRREFRLQGPEERGAGGGSAAIGPYCYF